MCGATISEVRVRRRPEPDASRARSLLGARSILDVSPLFPRGAPPVAPAPSLSQSKPACVRPSVTDEDDLNNMLSAWFRFWVVPPGLARG